jgi:MHS family citrate/tricarballylate:H+ symporter-like MFS transporter
MAERVQSKSKLSTVLRITSGNFLEMFDFFLFGFYATYISKTFFPMGSEFASLLATFTAFGAAFLMRPLGAIILGAYLDRNGRRKGLILTLAIMASGTILIAFVPGYASIGLLAPVLVLIGRLLQGFSAGVELGGVSVYLSEMATPGHKGLYVSWQSGSQQIAIMFAALMGYALNRFLSPAEISDWGWRIPFFVGCLIVPFVFVIRRSLQETEEFLEKAHRPGASEIVRSMVENWKIVVAGVLLVAMTTVSFYLITVYTPTFGRSVLKLDNRSSLTVAFCVGLSNFFLASCDGRGVGSDRSPAGAAHLHNPDDPDRISCAVMAGSGAVIRQNAVRRPVALVPLRRLQRRDGGNADRGHAA